MVLLGTKMKDAGGRAKEAELYHEGGSKALRRPLLCSEKRKARSGVHDSPRVIVSGMQCPLPGSALNEPQKLQNVRAMRRKLAKKRVHTHSRIAHVSAAVVNTSPDLPRNFRALVLFAITLCGPILVGLRTAHGVMSPHNNWLDHSVVWAVALSILACL